MIKKVSIGGREQLRAILPIPSFLSLPLFPSNFCPRELLSQSIGSKDRRRRAQHDPSISRRIPFIGGATRANRRSPLSFRNHAHDLVFPAPQKKFSSYLFPQPSWPHFISGVLPHSCLLSSIAKKPAAYPCTFLLLLPFSAPSIFPCVLRVPSLPPLSFPLPPSLFLSPLVSPMQI